MTDQQLLTLALAIIVPLSMLLYSNSRITDVRGSVTDAKETLRAEMQTLRTDMQKNHAELLAKLNAMEAAFEAKLKIHELEHHR
jgi:cell division protein FtsL